MKIPYAAASIIRKEGIRKLIKGENQIYRWEPNEQNKKEKKRGGAGGRSKIEL